MSARRLRSGDDITWPGFVDALSTLLLVLVFLLSIFALAQFFLANALSGRDAALERLRAQVAELGSLLSLERATSSELRDTIGQLSANLSSMRGERDDLSTRLDSLDAELADARARLAEAETRVGETGTELEDARRRYGLAESALAEEQVASARARSEVVRLQADLAALRQQLDRLAAALDASEQRDREKEATIADLGRRLNVALAGKVEELAGYRSEFFGRLREILGARSDIRIEGDRFVFQSELLFASGSAALGLEGREQMRRVAAALIEIGRVIPADIAWIVRVDGHTDRVPIATAEFAGNWELSAARAIAVVRFLVSEGVSPTRLAATGFGEYQPTAPGNDPESLRRNRRIELRLTQR